MDALTQLRCTLLLSQLGQKYPECVAPDWGRYYNYTYLLGKPVGLDAVHPSRYQTLAEFVRAAKQPFVNGLCYFDSPGEAERFHRALDEVNEFFGIQTLLTLGPLRAFLRSCLDPDNPYAFYWFKYNPKKLPGGFSADIWWGRIVSKLELGEYSLDADIATNQVYEDFSRMGRGYLEFVGQKPEFRVRAWIDTAKSMIKLPGFKGEPFSLSGFKGEPFSPLIRRLVEQEIPSVLWDRYCPDQMILQYRKWLISHNREDSPSLFHQYCQHQTTVHAEKDLEYANWLLSTRKECSGESWAEFQPVFEEQRVVRRAHFMRWQGHVGVSRGKVTQANFDRAYRQVKKARKEHLHYQGKGAFIKT